MKLILFNRGRGKKGGFNLVEATLSIGILSFGVLALLSLLAVGLNASYQARDDRATAQIAQMLVEDAQQGTLAAGTTYLDFEGAVCPATQAVYKAQTMTALVAGHPTLTLTTVCLTPLGAPSRARTYAVVSQTQP